MQNENAAVSYPERERRISTHEILRLRLRMTLLTFAICNLQFAVFLSGCASFQVAGEVQRGRNQLLFGDPKIALVHFQRAAEIDPNFVMSFSRYEEGVWTYVGRANYVTGRLPEARQALERALASYRHDSLARLYLGLTFARTGERQKGLGEIEGGMRGVYDWLEQATYNTEWGRFWDPLREIRSQIQKSLAMIGGKEIQWQQLIASGEWLGAKMEDEMDRAMWDERKERLQQGESDTPR